MSGKVRAMITLYYPKEKHVEYIRKIQKQADQVFLCDNSPYDNSNKFKNMVHTEYLYWGENRGLSAAFNTVLADAGYEWKDDDFVIFFDQDTRIPDGHIRKLIREYERLQDEGISVGCLGPCYYNTSNHKLELPRRKIRLSEHVLDVKSIITTSMLCRYGNIKKAGLWNEDVFLDMADWDLCWRFMDAGYKCCMTKASVIRHTVGTGEKKIGPVSLRVGMPVREYYELRDCRYLLNQCYVPLKFRLRFILMITVRSAVHLIFYNEKKKRLHYMWRAMLDYHKGVKGAYCELKKCRD